MRLSLRTAWASVLAGYRLVERRRQVRITVKHERKRVGGTQSVFTGVRVSYADTYIVTVTNRSPKRDLVVTRVWFDTVPPVEIATASQLPLELKPEMLWTKDVRASRVLRDADEVVHLARCQLSPDDKIIKSRPAR